MDKERRGRERERGETARKRDERDNEEGGRGKGTTREERATKRRNRK